MLSYQTLVKPVSRHLRHLELLQATGSAKMRVIHLELCCGEVDISHHLCTGVLHLQPRVQFQKVEAPILAVEVFHSPSTHITNHFGKFHRTLKEET